jgi:hypothetical protein
MNVNLLKKAQKQFRVKLKLIEQWVRLTTLLPPEFRGYVQKVDGDERLPQLDKEYEEAKKKAEKIMQESTRERVVDPLVPTWAVSDLSWQFNNNPAWDNVIRCYEEDR